MSTVVGSRVVMRWSSLRTRRRLSSVVAALAVTALGVAAWAHDGSPQADVDLNDGGVWVTSTDQHLVARLNYPSRQVDGAIRTTTSTFDVTQSENDVLVPDTAVGAVSAVNPTTVSLSTATQLTTGATIAQGGDRVIAVDGAAGTVRATSVSAVGSLASAPPVVESMPDVVAVAGTDGSVHAVSAKAGRAVTVPVTASAWDEPEQVALPLTAGTDVAVTAVGERTVVLDRGAGVLYLPDGASRDLGEAGLVLQQPGPDADAVLVASRTELISVPLDGSAPTTVPAVEEGTVPEGVAAQPVRLGDCVYSAWSGSGQFVRQCDGRTETVHDDALASSTTPVFRVNREAIVLNDITQGTVWLPDELLVLVEDWTDVTSQTDDTSEQEDDSAQTSESQTLPERTEENHAPEANDDTFGVRPGRSTILPVLANDSDPDGDVLTATPGDPGSAATVTTAQSGLALRLDVPEEATGTISLPYTADDGRGLSDSAVATVEVRDWTLNEAPVQTSTPTLTVSGNASASLSVLGSWQDPDGDTFYLVSAAGEGLDVRTTNEGTVTVRDLTGAPGAREVSVVVSDGRATATGTVTVDVQPSDTAVPVANADHVRVVAGTSAVVAPLDNDISPTGEALSLAAVQEAPTGTQVETNLQAGTFTFTAESAQTLYLTYDAAAGPRVAQGIVRIDVVEPSDPTVPPVTEDDTALLREGGAVTVAPLSNDFDPAGGILVLQSASAPAESGLSVTVVDHSLLQVSAAATIGQSVDVEYTVSNGTSTATGQVTVAPVTSEQVQVPVATQDTAVVRAGDVVSVPVLDNDTSPSGLALSVSDELGLAGDDLGTAWVSEDLVRFKAGDTPGRTSLSYTVTDTAGQTTSTRVDIEVRVRDDAANVAPSPQGLEAGTVAGSSTRITVPLDGIDPDGDSVSLVGLDQAPTMGSVRTGTTWLEYTPSAGAMGTDTFTYLVEDRFGAQSTATVRVGVAPASATNNAPQAVDDVVTAKPGRTVAADVVSNDLDADGDSLTLEGTPTSEDEALTLSVRGGQVVAELPQAEGVYTVRYTVTDSRGGTDLGTLTIQVLQDAPLISPVAVDDHVTVEQVDAAGVVTAPVLDNDKDADGSPWDLTLSTDDPGATVVDQSLRVTVGTERRFVLYTVTDQDGQTGHAVLVVPALSDLKPWLNSSAVPVRVPADTTTEVDLSSYVLTRAGTSPVVTAAEGLRTGAGLDSAEPAGDGGSLKITPTGGFTGQTTVSLTVADGTGDDALSSHLTLPIVVESTTNTPPVLTPTEIIVAPGEGEVTADLAQMTRDADEDPLTFSAGGAPEGFEVSLSGSTLSVSAAQGAAVGTTGSVDVTVDDATNDPVTVSVPLRVSDSTRPLMTTVPTTLESDGSPVSVDVAGLVTNPFPGQAVTLADAPRVTSGTGEVTASGTVLTISPGAGFSGRLVVSYTALDATGSMARAASGTVTVTVASPPDAPVGVTAQPAGASSMQVSWTPGSDNGSSITGYTLTETSGAGTWSCTGSPCLASGLSMGGTYSFSVVATNAVGSSSPSAASAPVRLTLTPTAPSSLTAVDGGEGAVDLSWQPSSAPDASVTYDVAIMQGGSVVASQTTTGTSVRLAVRPGTYTAQVCAYVDAAGQKNCASVSVRSVDQPTAPGAPNVEYRAGAGLLVSWGAAGANGGSLSYSVTVSGAVTTTVSAGGATSVTVPTPSLGSGRHAVTVTVTATTEVGSASSPPTSAEFRVTSAPPRPSVPVAAATGTSGQITVTTPATPVAGNGWDDDDIDIEYRVVDSAGNEAAGWGESTTFSGLRDGTSYTVQARAVGEDDSAAVSEVVSSNAVTPQGPPSAPSVSCTPAGTGVSCSWTAGTGGGRATSHEGATSSDGANTEAVAASGTKTFEPGAGGSATWCVRSTNDLGHSSAWSCDSATASVGQGTFRINTTAPEAVCTAQDLRETGFPANSCWRIVIDVTGFAPNSTVTCSYQYRDRLEAPDAPLKDYSESFSVDSSGGARKVFPHRASSPNQTIACVQR